MNVCIHFATASLCLVSADVCSGLKRGSYIWFRVLVISNDRVAAILAAGHRRRLCGISQGNHRYELAFIRCKHIMYFLSDTSGKRSRKPAAAQPFVGGCQKHVFNGSGNTLDGRNGHFIFCPEKKGQDTDGSVAEKTDKVSRFCNDLGIFGKPAVQYGIRFLVASAINFLMLPSFQDF